MSSSSLQYLSYMVFANYVLHVVRVYVLRSDPSHWSATHVRLWLQWAVDNFNLEGIDAAQFQCIGVDLLHQGRDKFLLRAPPYVGDILWEHLDILQKGSLYHSPCISLAGAATIYLSMFVG